MVLVVVTLGGSSGNRGSGSGGSSGDSGGGSSGDRGCSVRVVVVVE